MPAYLSTPEHLEVRDQHGAQCLGHWFDPGSGKVFCLIEAPDEVVATAVHRRAHRLQEGA